MGAFRKSVVKFKMTSTKTTFVLILVSVFASEVGGDNANLAKFSDGSNTNGDSSLCRAVRNTRNSVISLFKQQYSEKNTFCNIYNHCTNVTCSTELSRGKVIGGVLLNLCSKDLELTYWADLPGQWDQPWNHTFSSKNLNGPERKEITGNSNSSRKALWFIKVNFITDGGHSDLNQDLKYIAITSTLQICQNQSEDSCTNTTLLKFPRLPKVQLCEPPVLQPDDIAEDLHHRQVYMFLHNRYADIGSYPSSTRSSRHANAMAWDPEAVHKSAAEKANQFENSGPLKATPGDKCNLDNIFGCGPGATCSALADGSGTCQCLPDYEYKSSLKICTKMAPDALPDTSGQDSMNSRSYSAAIGAVISIVILVGLAGGIFYGIKYNYFARIRHRIPVIRCWPFRRPQPWEDNVTMVEQRF